MDIVEAVYRVTGGFPKSELYGLTGQVRRAAVSIPSNIAEGHTRASTKEYFIDQPGYRGKQKIFEDILHDYRLQPGQVLIMGDNHDSEIAAGVRLGIRTVQTLRPGVPHSPAATYHVQTLHALRPLLILDD